MTDNEFDHLFSENLKNARPVISPDANEWHALSARLDQFQSRRRNWLKFLPWLLLPFLTGFSVWSGISLYQLKNEKYVAGISRHNQSTFRDTIIIEKEKYFHDTLYKVTYIDRISKEMVNQAVMDNTDLVFPSEDLIGPKEIKIADEILVEENEPITQRLDTAGFKLLENKEEIKIPDENKKMSKFNGIIGLSAGALLPLGLEEIKNPIAFQWTAAWIISPTFSLAPSLIFTQHFFETEDLSSSKVMLSSSINPSGAFILHEIKGMERNILPTLSLNYNLKHNYKIKVYAGVGLGVKMTLPVQLTYEFIEFSKNSSYKYNLVNNKISAEMLAMGNVGGSMKITSGLSLFAEAKMGISKGKMKQTSSLLATFLGVGYQFSSKNKR
jgi:hypothetical protein